MNHKELKLLLLELKERGVQEVVEANDMDKMMRLECRGDYGSAYKECTCDSLECPKKREKQEQIRKGCLKLYDICGKLSLRCSHAT